MQHKSLYRVQQSKQLNYLSSSNIYNIHNLQKIILQFMSRHYNFIETLNITNSILNLIVDKAQQTIKINHFAKRNQPIFIVQSQQKMFNSNLKHFLQRPQHSLTKLELQPRQIPQDNFMNAGIYEKLKSISQNKDKVSIKFSSGRYTKRSITKEDNEPKAVRHKIKQTFISKLQVLFKQSQVKQQQDFYVQHLRTLKIEQDKAAKAGKPKIKPKPVCVLGKDQQIVYDYQGNFSKRKQNQRKEFEGNSVEGGPIKPLDQIQSSSRKSNEKATPIEILNRSRDRSQFSKLRTSQQDEYKQKMFQTNNKEEVINQIQIKHSGIKIIVDGNPIKKKQNMESNFQDVVINPKTVMLKKVKESLRQRFKTQNVGDLEMVTKQKKKEKNSKKSRIATQFHESLPPKTGKISIQSQSLHSFVIHNQEEYENRYIQLPSKQSFQRRMKTNVQKTSRLTTQFSKLKERSTSLMKPKERSTSLNKQGGHLPKILSTQHHQIEAQVFRQFRDKCKQF